MKKDWHLAKRLYDLAAETNSDAKVPVAIALFKLQMLAKIESIKEVKHITNNSKNIHIYSNYYSLPVSLQIHLLYG